MSETVSLNIETEAFREGMEAVRAELQSLVENDLNPLAEETDRLFTSLGRSITENLEEAAARGKLSVKGLVNDVLADLSRLAAEQFVRQPLENILSTVLGGTRAGGGPVSSGIPYLVGERGPELFVPSSAGVISPNAAPVTVNIAMPQRGRADPLGRSDTQLAGQISRALRKAMRNA